LPSLLPGSKNYVTYLFTLKKQLGEIDPDGSGGPKGRSRTDWNLLNSAWGCVLAIGHGAFLAYAHPIDRVGVS